MFQDIQKMIELFYIVFLFIYNKWDLFAGNISERDTESTTLEINMPDEIQGVLSSIEITGSQQTYSTRVSKTKKSICDYPEDMTILICHMLTSDTDSEKQILLSQLFRGVDYSVEEDEIIVNLNDDIDARVTISRAIKDKAKKNAVVRDIKINIESYYSTKEEVLNCINEIKKPYVKVNGQVKPKFINEMYIYYFDEPCLLEHQQVMKIKKTVKDVVQYYGSSNNHADRFLKSLLT